MEEPAAPPSVDSIVRRLYDGSVPRRIVTRIVRGVVQETTFATDSDRARIENTAAFRVERAMLERPRRIVNASGVLLHTNLGRAPWSTAAVEAASLAGAGYCNVELSLYSGGRGERAAYLHDLIVELCGGESALVVNNNAAAVLLALSSLASRGSVPVSRGELIEIGGSYRLPDLMAASGAKLVEVGTTNRTRLADYAAVIDETTRLLLKVHPSNYRVLGFTEEAPMIELAELARSVGLPLIYDVGSGLIDETTPWLDEHPPRWLAGEPGVRQALHAGADLVLFSGDKLLGGPQAGIVVGKADLIDELRASPLARALRVDGVTVAGLVATLEAYADRRELDIPLWRMATVPYGVLERRAAAVVQRSGITAQLVAGASTLGGGSVPGSEIPTPLVELGGSADLVFDRLLAHSSPVLARRAHGRVYIDLRAVEPEDDEVVSEAIAAACR